MAQLGCYVPAVACTLSPMDRIFTRIGASDNILAGQSTFMVELQETSKILSVATPRSLLILDELGRGTSTFDGYGRLASQRTLSGPNLRCARYAIAYAVLRHIIVHLGCVALFSTHYHMLTDEFADNALVGLYHMSCLVNDEKYCVAVLRSALLILLIGRK